MTIARLAPLALLLVAGSGLAGSPAPPPPDQAGYDLFHPVPDALLRPLDTDRPDKTNSPRTLDAGHFQVESGLATFTRNEDAGVRTEGWRWIDTDLRVGLTSRAELQLEIPFFEARRDTDLASRETDRSSGFGDVTVVAKTNFWGNDGGATAGGAELFVKLPTASGGVGSREVEGGASFLLDLSLPAGFDLGVNSGLAAAADDGGGHHLDVVASASLSRAIAGPLSVYLEFFSSVPAPRPGDWEGTVDVGSTLTIGRSFQLDAGVNVGVTGAADDLEPFVGASYRF